MPELLIDGIPSNLVMPAGGKAIPVESDLYNVCERLREISPRLFVVVLDPPLPMVGHPDRTYNFAVMQHCEDGVERLFFKVEYLDARVVQKAAEYVHVPLNERIERIDKDQRKLEQDQLNDQLDELYERMGGPMWVELERNGFIDSRPVSYRKMNRTAMRSRRSRRAAQ